jgi:sporulation protein YabP
VSEEAGHRLEVGQRKETRVDGVRHVESFTEQEILVDTNMGLLVLAGEGLNITQLDLEAGRLQVEGYINSIEYKDSGYRKTRRGKNILSRILK